ncbi:shieldin complex subunit 1 isoform X2 [Fukomys damarensis]|uniref:shieldin complex subunit 1 isoform X2 n=1 Tax=Fukomys damarensis TaxID=885580 RepID=UPI00053F8E8C|nr:shieldin complex subunit 1 isoform X2 [Fukomys damarensis]XP_019060595.1 shieldin complex subunit 1 isoform X2 [Fukomys damarensis]
MPEADINQDCPDRPPCHPNSSNLNTELKDSQSCENFWLDPSAKGQLEAKDEDAGLRESLDRFYDVFGRPQPASEDPLLASVCHCLSQKIAELQGQGSQKYALRSFQMARVIFSREGCSVLRKHCRDTRFYPLCEGSLALDDEKQTPGLSKDVIHFLLQQNVMEDP